MAYQHAASSRTTVMLCCLVLSCGCLALSCLVLTCLVLSCLICQNDQPLVSLNNPPSIGVWGKGLFREPVPEFLCDGEVLPKCIYDPDYRFFNFYCCFISEP